jgi:hypothetical protein
VSVKLWTYYSNIAKWEYIYNKGRSYNIVIRQGFNTQLMLGLLLVHVTRFNKT